MRLRFGRGRQGLRVRQKPVLRHCPLAEAPGGLAAWAKHVNHLLAGSKQVVGDDPTVTAPPDGLGAHDGRALLVAQLAQCPQRLAELRRECVVGVVVKAAVLPPPELTVLVPRTRAAELSQYLTHLSRYRGRNDMLHALDRDHPVLYPGKLLHKLLHRHTSRFLNMP